MIASLRKALQKWFCSFRKSIYLLLSKALVTLLKYSELLQSSPLFFIVGKDGALILFIMPI